MLRCADASRDAAGLGRAVDSVVLATPRPVAAGPKSGIRPAGRVHGPRDTRDPVEHAEVWTWRPAEVGKGRTGRTGNRRRGMNARKAALVWAILLPTALVLGRPRTAASTLVSGGVTTPETDPTTYRCAYKLRFCPGSCGGATTSGYAAQPDLDPDEQVRDLHFKIAEGGSLPPIELGNYSDLKLTVHRVCVVDPDSDPNTQNNVEREGAATDVTGDWNGPQWANGAKGKEMVLTAKEGKGIDLSAGTAPTVLVGENLICCCLVVSVSWNQPKTFQVVTGGIAKSFEVTTGDLFVVATNNAGLTALEIQSNNGALALGSRPGVTGGQRREGSEADRTKPKLPKFPGPTLKTTIVGAWAQGQPFLAAGATVAFSLATHTDPGHGFVVHLARSISTDAATDPMGIGLNTADFVPAAWGLTFVPSEGTFDADRTATVSLSRSATGTVPTGVTEAYAVVVVKDAAGGPMFWSRPVAIPLVAPD